MSESIEGLALSAVIEERYDDARAELEKLEPIELQAFARQCGRLDGMAWQVHDEKIRAARAADRKENE